MSRSQDRRVAVQREADPIARLRATVDAAQPQDGVVVTAAMREARASLAYMAPELLAVVEAAEHEPRTNADGETTTLALALDTLRARAAEVLHMEVSNG